MIQSQVPRTGDKPGFYYVGSTTDPARRLYEHNNTSKGAKFTARFRPWLARGLYGPYASRSEAMKAELELKKKITDEKLHWSPQDSPLCRGEGSSHPWVTNSDVWPPVKEATSSSSDLEAGLSSKEAYARLTGQVLSNIDHFEKLMLWGLPVEDADSPQVLRVENPDPVIIKNSISLASSLIERRGLNLWFFVASMDLFLKVKNLSEFRKAPEIFDIAGWYEEIPVIVGQSLEKGTFYIIGEPPSGNMESISATMLSKLEVRC